MTKTFQLSLPQVSPSLFFPLGLLTKGNKRTKINITQILHPSLHHHLYSLNLHISHRINLRGLMDSEGCSTQNPVSVLPSDKFFLNRVISRELSMGCSSRIYYRSAVGVPFKWENQPGESKSSPGKEAIPPIREPPALLSLGLPKPCIVQHKGTIGSRASKAAKAWFCKMSKRRILSGKVRAGSKRNGNGEGMVSEKLESSGLSNSDVEFIDSLPYNSSSSSSMNDHSSQSSGIHTPARDSMHGPFGCSPWSVAGIIVSVTKRV